MRFPMLGLLITFGFSALSQPMEEPALWRALAAGDVQAVKLALEQGGDVNQPFGQRGLPLHEAVRLGRQDLVTLLLDGGARLDARDLNGWTPAMVAASQGHLALLTYLRGLGAELDVAENQGITALMWAVANNSPEVVAYLIEEGVDVHAADMNGRTALDMVNDYDPEIKKMMVASLQAAGVEKGDAADLVRALRKAGKTPADLTWVERSGLVNRLMQEGQVEDAGQVLAATPAGGFSEKEVSTIYRVAEKLPFEQPHLANKILLFRRLLTLKRDHEMGRLMLAGALYKAGEAEEAKTILVALSQHGSEKITSVAKRTLGAMELNEKGDADAMPFFDSEGKPLDFAAYKGKVVLLDFWASWCKPCIQSVPGLKELAGFREDRPFEIIGVSGDRDQKAWQRAIEKLDMNWPHYLDPGNAAVKIFGVKSIPTYILINHEGKAIYKTTGWSPARKDELANQIQRALRKAERAAKKRG